MLEKQGKDLFKLKPCCSQSVSFLSCFNSHLERAHSAAHCSNCDRCSFSQGMPSDGSFKKKSISMHSFFLDFSWHMKGIGKKNSGPSFHWPHLHIVQAFSVKRHWRHKEPITTDPDPSWCYWGVTHFKKKTAEMQFTCTRAREFSLFSLYYCGVFTLHLERTVVVI